MDEFRINKPNELVHKEPIIGQNESKVHWKCAQTYTWTCRSRAHSSCVRRASQQSLTLVCAPIKHLRTIRITRCARCATLMALHTHWSCGAAGTLKGSHHTPLAFGEKGFFSPSPHHKYPSPQRDSCNFVKNRITQFQSLKRYRGLSAHGFLWSSANLLKYSL